MPELFIEIPHGATRTADFTGLAAELRSPLPESLVDFFHVNTDAGAPELADAVAERLGGRVKILRCAVPRTFIDCNRRIDASPAEFKAGKVTPGLMPWITADEDRALLRAKYEAYVAEARAAIDALPPDGAILMLHTYAPRTVDVEVDMKIVESLHRAYETPEKWPLRPPVDVIGRTAEGESLAPAAVVETLRAEMAKLGIEVADSKTYPLHPSTMAHEYVMKRPGRTLCVEFRRDLLADPWDPFVEQRISPEKVARLAEPLVTALRRWW